MQSDSAGIAGRMGFLTSVQRAFVVSALLVLTLVIGVTKANAQDNEPKQGANGEATQAAKSSTISKAQFEAKAITQDYAENYAFSDAAQRKTFLKLTEELRCPKCQNQNIADSDAPIAHDMRRKVYQLMQEGKGEQEVVGWMKQRYGDFVHYQPPVNAVTMWLWLAPVIFALVMLVVFIRRRKVVDDVDVEARLARADKLLKDD
ncbi:cytochrome c-type biogenesis protein CcmH [Glaciecola siphonariae]|uniref:Cytochrome c-type biogenesis protein n=1 Tax=Glaciecola siphonariae TaxID=521012 RepID=A0ABV9LWP0_9ALTE